MNTRKHKVLFSLRRRLDDIVLTFSVLLLVSALCAPAPAQDWDSLGPEGGFVKSIVVHPRNPDIVFAGSDDSGGIWKSTDGGDSWRLVSEELSNLTGWELNIDPSNPEVMYCTDCSGRHALVKSVDGGETWVRKTHGLEPRANCLSVLPGNSSVLYVGTGEEQKSLNNGLYRSIDGGENWHLVALKGRDVSCLAIDQDKIIFAGTDKGLHRSRNNARDWELLSRGVPSDSQINVIEIAPSGTLYVAAMSGPEETEFDHSVFKSSDGGDTWQGLGLPHKFVWNIVVARDTDEQVLYCGTLFDPIGLAKTVDGGRTWEPMNKGLTGRTIIGLAESSDGTLYLGNFGNQGIFRSKDKAETWHQTNKGFRPTSVSGMSLDPSNPSRLIVTCLGTYDNLEHSVGPCTWELLLSKKGRPTWRRWDFAATTFAPSISPKNPELVVFGTFEKGFCVSPDNGATIRAIVDKGTCSATVFSQYDSSVSVASVVDFATGESRVYRSVDGAQTWSSAAAPFAVQQFLSEANAPRIWAATDKGVYLSEDNGESWRSRGLEGSEIIALAQHPSQPATLYAGGKDASLHESKDAGLSWTPISHPVWPSGCDVHELALHPTDPTKLYVGLTGAELVFAQRNVQRGGLWMSPDGGRSWTDLTADLHNDHIHGDILFTPDNKTLLAGTYTGGVVRLKI